MIQLAHARAVIPTHVSELYTFVVNMENYSEWFPGVVEVVSGNRLAHGSPGKRYVETLELPTVTTMLTIEVEAAVPNQLFITNGDLEPVLPRMEICFEGISPSASEFDLSYYSRNPERSEDDDIITCLRDDLGKRVNVAMQNLQNRTWKNRMN